MRKGVKRDTSPKRKRRDKPPPLRSGFAADFRVLPSLIAIVSYLIMLLP
jgi:hypothetical protein